MELPHDDAAIVGKKKRRFGNDNGIIRCVENFCYFAKENLPTVVGLGQKAIVQVAKGEIPTSLGGAKLQNDQRKLIAKDVELLKSLIANCKRFLSRAKRFQYPLCQMTELEVMLQGLEDRTLGYETSENANYFNKATNDYFMGSSPEWYREQIHLDLSLVLSLANMMQMQVAEFLSLRSERQYAQSNEQREQIDQYIAQFYEACSRY